MIRSPGGGPLQPPAVRVSGNVSWQLPSCVCRLYIFGGALFWSPTYWEPVLGALLESMFWESCRRRVAGLPARRSSWYGGTAWHSMVWRHSVALCEWCEPKG